MINRLNKGYVSIISYTDERDYIPQGMFTGGTPTTWFLNSDGEPMFAPVSGARGADDYMSALQVVQEKFDEINKNGKIK